MFYPFDYKYSVISPDPFANQEDQLSQCLSSLKNIADNLKGKEIPIRINWFFRASESLDCDSLFRKIKGAEIIKYLKIEPVVIAQSPTDGADFQVLLTSVRGLKEENVEYHSVNNKSYVSMKAEGGKWIYFGGNGCSSTDPTIRQSAEKSFTQASDILRNEGMVFSNIIRQWNYIPDIVGLYDHNDQELQNYQEFNEVRKSWYFDNGFVRDFPSATGIGTKGSVVRIEMIACEIDNNFQLNSINNPDQQNAHEYSYEKLVGSIRESTPLFERGKFVFGKDKGHIWVSGTAAIKGEDSIDGNILEQTETTCNNIDRLIEVENLIDNGLPADDYKISGLYVRAYVKFESQGPKVKKYLEEKYQGALVHVLEADVCRKELLVEIEAEFSIMRI